MKNFQYLPFSVRSSALVFLFILASLLACKKDSDPTPTGVEGDWLLTAVTINPVFLGVSDYFDVTGSSCRSQITFSFKGDGSLGVSAPATCASTKDLLFSTIGINSTTTWKSEGNKLTLTTGSSVLELNLSVNATDMSLAATNTPLPDGLNHTITFVFKRK